MSLLFSQIYSNLNHYQSQVINTHIEERSRSPPENIYNKHKTHFTSDESTSKNDGRVYVATAASIGLVPPNDTQWQSVTIWPSQHSSFLQLASSANNWHWSDTWLFSGENSLHTPWSTEVCHATKLQVCLSMANCKQKKGNNRNRKLLPALLNFSD